MAPAELAQVIKRSHAALTRTQRDGWGYSIGGYLEKWNSPKDWSAPDMSRAITSALKGAAVELDAVSVGDFPAPGAPLVCHARTATCARGAANAHPHVSGGWIMAHNGVVEPRRNSKRKSCDSMYIVESLARVGGPSKLHCDIAGYAAIVGTTPAGEPFALRDSRAPLVINWVPAWEAFVLSSGAEYSAEIIGKQEHTRPVSLLPWVYHVWTGEDWATHEVQPWASSVPRAIEGRSRRGNKLDQALAEAADKALGAETWPFPDYEKGGWKA